ncbi:hypothetical protein QYM36_014732 [Artemia franciscana]|uniref:Reverse transcriptase domain-containing protein n=1 Tax=Artemia franciscana TaxID=6661 RepID=A0AA88HL01_ARTSF|nr:hypothetical protein QYM36_014732 [Artemia franciscana]
MGFVKVATSISSLSTKKSGLKNPIPKEFDDVFAGIGKLPGKVEIHVEKNAIPSVNPVRRIPFALHEKVKSELERLKKLDIIERVVTPTEWVNSIVAVEKSDGSLRLCLDPRELNKSIQRPYYPMPTFEDIAAKIHGHNKFSKLDATSGYLMLALTEKSSLVTTFNTPFGRYKYKRMSFGLICAQDEFQRKMEETLGNLKGLGVIVDDILISGKDEEHDENLRKVLEKAREVGVRFNPEKCIFGSTSVPYFGHLITADGIKPDPSKVQAIIEMPHPSNKDKLATFLGMTNFLSKYIPNLSSLSYPLGELGKQTAFEWNNEHATAMNRIRTLICNNLATFDTKAKSVEMKTNASKHGLGAELSIGGKTVAFGSRALTSTEQNYSQIEKELYAILYGCKKFHQFVYGRRIIAHTDHKPLEAILSKLLSQAPPRLQRMMIQLQPYDITVQYVRGKDLPVADTLSRLHPPHFDEECSLEIEFHVHSVMKSIPAQWKPRSSAEGNSAQQYSGFTGDEDLPAEFHPPVTQSSSPKKAVPKTPDNHSTGEIFQDSPNRTPTPPPAANSESRNREDYSRPYVTRTGRVVKPRKIMDI